eukprot:1214484-Pyramimonas_sp.AAC.1
MSENYKDVRYRLFRDQVPGSGSNFNLKFTENAIENEERWEVPSANPGQPQSTMHNLRIHLSVTSVPFPLSPYTRTRIPVYTVAHCLCNANFPCATPQMRGVTLLTGQGPLQYNL